MRARFGVAPLPKAFPLGLPAFISKGVIRTYLMSTTDIWMPLFVGDYIRDTMHLSTEEHGAYLLLIMHYWVTGGAIEDDDTFIATVARIKPSRVSKKTIATVRRFFESKNGYLHHHRIDEELRKSAENKDKQRKKTEAATAARRNVTKNVTKNVTIDVTSTPSPSPSPNSNKQTSYTAARGAVDKPVYNSGSFYKNEFDIKKFFDDTCLHMARQAADGWDVYYLAEIFNENVHNGKLDIPNHPAKAFAGWCKKYTTNKTTGG